MLYLDKEKRLTILVVLANFPDNQSCCFVLITSLIIR